MRRMATGRGDRGATAVEFAIILPLLVLLVFGVIEFARLMSAYSSIRTASREAARYGSAVGLSPNNVPRYSDCDEIRNAGKKLVTGARLSDSNIVVSYDDGPGTSSIASCPVGGLLAPALVGPGDRIVVTVTTQFRSVVPLLRIVLDGRTISATDRRTIFKGS